MPKRRNIEGQIQIAIAQHLNVRGVPGLVFWHTPNGAFMGKHGAIHAAILKRQGLRPGVSDVIAFRDAKLYCMEIKAPGGRPTEPQLEFLSDVSREGAFTAIAEGLDEAIKILEMWGLIRPTR